MGAYVTEASSERVEWSMDLARRSYVYTSSWRVKTDRLTVGADQVQRSCRRRLQGAASKLLGCCVGGFEEQGKSGGWSRQGSRVWNSGPMTSSQGLAPMAYVIGSLVLH